MFILVVSLSLKVDKVSGPQYSWQAAFWPCWGLEGAVILLVVVAMPWCLTWAITDRPKLLMLAWIIASASGLGVSSFMSMYNVASMLDSKLCPTPVVPDDVAPEYAACRHKLSMALWPWLVFLPLFSLWTALFKRRLAVALHDEWYSPPGRMEQLPEPRVLAPPVLVEDREPPEVMFRATATYYMRVPDLAVLEGGENAVGNTFGGGSVLGLQNSASVLTVASRNMLGSAVGVPRSLDPSTSILSARGANFADIVESEQLCFICYDQPPNGVLLECGHAGICCDCAGGVVDRRPGHATCPICRTPISMVLRLRRDLPVPAALFARASSGTFRQVTGSMSRVCDMESGDNQESGGGGAARPSASSSSYPLSVPSAPAMRSESSPWPAAASRYAVAVEVVRGPRASRGWLANILR